MIALPQSQAALHSDDFGATLRRELEALPVTTLPLQNAMSVGSMLSDDPIQVMITRTAMALDADTVQLSVGVFFHSVIAGCNCSDDPTPVDTHNEYAEFQLTLSRTQGLTEVVHIR